MRFWFAGIVLTWLLVIAPAGPALALSTADFLNSLSAEEADDFQVWRQARAAFETKLDSYWERVEQKRQARKAKRTPQVVFAPDDYVMSFPPQYSGPKLSPSLAKKYEKFADAQEAAQPSPPKQLPVVADYVEAARRVYNFTPERLSEKDFKRRYAEEALALGLKKDQVVRVYALETGGIGTYDMQAGINPVKKTGRAISSALGYAQLLDANSVNELVSHGQSFIDRLMEKTRRADISAARRMALLDKVKAVRKMFLAAKRIPYNWERHQAYAKTPEGMGPHALNLDGDVGPLLQAVKLRGLKDIAEKAGRAQLSGAEMEAMNLAGPVTGLEMMMPAGRKAPTPNFFARRAYYVNKMVIGLTGEQLLAELDRRMTSDINTPGSIEFAQAFDAAEKNRSAQR